MTKLLLRLGRFAERIRNAAFSGYYARRDR